MAINMGPSYGGGKATSGAIGQQKMGMNQQRKAVPRAPMRGGGGGAGIGTHKDKTGTMFAGGGSMGLPSGGPQGGFNSRMIGMQPPMQGPPMGVPGADMGQAPSNSIFGASVMPGMEGMNDTPMMPQQGGNFSQWMSGGRGPMRPRVGGIQTGPSFGY